MYIVGATLVCSSVFWFLYTMWISRKEESAVENEPAEKEDVSEVGSKNGVPV